MFRKFLAVMLAFCVISSTAEPEQWPQRLCVPKTISEFIK
jgi:hypothetical protein